MHAPIFAMFSLFFLPLSFFLSLRSFYSQFLTTFLPWISPFYPQGFTNCFCLVVGIPSRLPTNPLVARPLPLLKIHLLHHYSFRDKIQFCLFLLYTSTSRFKWIRIGLPHHLPLWHASDGPSHILLLLGKIPSQQGIFLKEVTAGNQIQTHFPPTAKPHPLNPLDHGLTSIVLVGYKLVVLRPLCVCCTIFCFCLLSFSWRSCHSRLALFRSAVSLPQFFMRFLLCLSFPLVWLFCPSRNSCC